MGPLLESLWGFYSRDALSRRFPDEYDLAWIVDNEYNDFALLQAGVDWDSVAGDGEHLRIEAKSMNLGADECVQILGGYGYMKEYEIERAYRDVRLNRIGAGTDEVLLEVIGRSYGL